MYKQSSRDSKGIDYRTYSVEVRVVSRDTGIHQKDCLVFVAQSENDRDRAKNYIADIFRFSYGQIDLG